MGVLNYENNSHSGENNFLHYELEHINDGIVLDVGANVGGYCSAIRELYKDCTIYAFEPHPKTYNQLEKNTKNFNIKSLNLGVGASDGTLVLYDYASNDGSQHASLYKGVIEKIHNRQAVEHSVKVIAIDDFIAEKW
jgi:FkbM family methyltransferase